MPIDDLDLFTSVMFLFVWLFLIGLGRRLSPMFFILSGFIGIGFATELYRISAPSTSPFAAVGLSVSFAAISLMIMVFGIFDARKNGLVA